MLDNTSPDRFWVDSKQIDNSEETIDLRRSLATQIDALGLEAVVVPVPSMPRLRFAIDPKLDLFLADIPVDICDQAGRPTGIRIVGPRQKGVDEVIHAYMSVCRDLQWPPTQGAQNTLREVFLQRPKVSWVALATGLVIMLLILGTAFLERSCRQ